MSLVITGVIDGPLPGGLPKAIELYATASIADLSVYGIRSANNGGGSDGEEFTFPSTASAAAGQFLYVASEDTAFAEFFGFAPDFTDSAANINGDDAIELFQNGVVIDVFGDIDTDGTGEPWEHLDGWAYRNANTGPNADIFNVANWTFSGPNALDGESSSSSASAPFPAGTFTAMPQPLVINEVLVSTTSTDVEFVELFGEPGTSLDGLSLVNIESDDASGTIDSQFDFGPGDVIGDNGFFLAGNSLVAGALGVIPNTEIPANFFENSSSTIALVETASLTGSTVDGSETVIDALGLADDSSGTFYYNAPILGPDGSFYPSAAARVPDGGDFQLVDAFSPAGENTSPTAGTGGTGTIADL
ncbi:MAG: endonuclease I, partial [Pseudomonadota bacterium]